MLRKRVAVLQVLLARVPESKVWVRVVVFDIRG